MDWQHLIDEGVVESAPSSRQNTVPTIRRAWECVVEARQAYLEARWEGAEAKIRDAFCVATDALVGYYDLRVRTGSSFDTARRIGADYFGERVSEPIFDKALILSGMLPLAPEVDTEQAREVRRSVAASSEYVALVECFTYRV